MSMVHTPKCQINGGVPISRGAEKIPKINKWGEVKIKEGSELEKWLKIIIKQGKEQKRFSESTKLKYIQKCATFT